MENSTANELKAYLEGVYPDYEIGLSTNDDGAFVYTIEGTEVLTIPSSQIDDAYTQLTGSTLSTTDKEIDPNKLKKSTGKRRNYGATNVVNIDVALFNDILSNITKGKELIEGITSLDVSSLEGSLASYYSQKISVLGDVNELLKGEKTNSSELEFKVDASIKAYQEIDEDLKYGMNVVFANIFSMDSTDIATYNMSVEEREDYIDGLITSYSEILEDFKEQYTALMGEGVKLDSDAFTAWASMINYFPVLDSNATTVNANLFLDNGNVNLNQLALYSSAWNDSGIKDKLSAYLSGKSWEESGLSSYNSDVTHISESGFLVHMASIVNGTDSYNNYLSTLTDPDASNYLGDIQDGDLTNKQVLLNYLNSDSIMKIDSNFTDTLNTKAQLESDIYTLENTIYNYRQYKGLMVYEEYAKDPRYSAYLASDLSFALTDPTLSKDGLYNYLDSSEVALYKLILDTEGEEKANGYITALSDTINQRKGYEIAANFCQNMNQDGGDVGDFLYAGAVGFGDGVENFFAGLSNFFGGADGVRSVQDYEHMYKVKLLGSNNDYTNNLSSEYRTVLGFQYQAFTSIGNNAIPMLISFTPIPGARTISSALMGLSAAGNSTEDALQNGATMGQAYLYGSLSGASEVLLERVLGSLPGISDSSYAQGTETLLQSMFGEAKEEVVQTYLDGAFRATILGEPFDISGLTDEAATAALTAMYCAGISNVGAKGLIKIGDVIVTASTDGTFTSYEAWCESIRSQISNDVAANLPDSVQKLLQIGSYAVTTDTGINVDPTQLADSTETNMGTGGASTIDGITFDPDSNSYLIRFKNGSTMTTTDIDTLTTMDCLTQTFGIDENFAAMADTWFNGGCDDAVVQRLVNDAEVLGYENVGNLMNLLSDPEILALYSDARTNVLPDLETFRTHGIGHITDVLDASVDAYVSLRETGGADNVNPMTMAVAALMHDTGMSGGEALHAYTNSDGLLVIDPNLMLDGDTGNCTRGNHSFNSGLDTLFMRDTILEYFPDADVDMAAIMAFAHSKSNSGVMDLSTPEGWTVAIQALDAGIEANNAAGGNYVFTNPDGGTTTSFIEHLMARGIITGVSDTASNATIKFTNIVDVDGVPTQNSGKVQGKVYAFTFGDGVLEELGESGYLMRIGDSNTTNENFGYNQFGEEIAVPTDTNGNVLADKPASIMDGSKQETAGIEFTVGGEGKSGGAQFVIGESNIEFGTDTLTITGDDGTVTKVMAEEFVVKDGDYFPYSTLTQFEERMGEMSSSGSDVAQGQSVVIRLPADTGDYALGVYKDFVSSDLGRNIDGMYLYVGDELVYSQWR